MYYCRPVDDIILFPAFSSGLIADGVALIVDSSSYYLIGSPVEALFNTNIKIFKIFNRIEIRPAHLIFKLCL